jgi:hypothetical protein
VLISHLCYGTAQCGIRSSVTEPSDLPRRRERAREATHLRDRLNPRRQAGVRRKGNSGLLTSLFRGGDGLAAVEADASPLHVGVRSEGLGTSHHDDLAFGDGVEDGLHAVPDPVEQRGRVEQDDLSHALGVMLRKPDDPRDRVGDDERD